MARECFSEAFGEQAGTLLITIANEDGEQLTYTIPGTIHVRVPEDLRPKAKRILQALTRTPQTPKKIAAALGVPLDTDFYEQLRELLRVEPAVAVKGADGIRLA